MCCITFWYVTNTVAYHLGQYEPFDIDVCCNASDLPRKVFYYLLIAHSVTRLGDFLHFGQFFKAFGNNDFAQISHILRQFL